MEIFLRVNLNFASTILLGSILIFAYRRLDGTDKINQMFFRTSFAILIQMVAEALSCIIEGHQGKLFIGINIILNLIIYINSSFVTYLFYKFVETWIGINIPKNNIREIILRIPLIINFVISMISPVTRFVFYITKDNNYYRGPLFWVSAVSGYFYLFYTVYLLLKTKQRLTKEEFFLLIMFGIWPSIAGILQIIFYGVLLMWSTAGFALVVVFIFIQQRLLQFDLPTGAWTKSSFEQYIARNFYKEKSIDEFWGVIFFDLDQFKQINDKYGHLEGDFVLKQTVKLIKDSLRPSDIVARFGGDEFVMLIKGTTESEMCKTLSHMSENFSSYNKTSEKPYKIEYSYGYGIFNSRKDDIEEFLRKVDNLMYQNKRNNIL